MKRLLFAFALIASFATTFAQNTTVSYTSSTADFPNPERGFYYPTETTASNYTPLVLSDLQNKRNPYMPWQANFSVHSTLVFRYFILDDFVNSAISTSFLNSMQADFDIARQAGVKLIVRYSYTNTAPTGSCGSWICPPYGDATKAQVLQHIAQLKPYLQANSDIIATLQMGFIGVWGENYYTDHFGDASIQGFISNSNWNDRNEVLDSLLTALPSDRSIQVRYPQLKQRLIYGTTAPTNSAALTTVEAHTGSHKARIGFHNDCFLASDTDFGTYSDYGPPVAQDDTTNLKPYLELDSRYVPVGGETCSANNPDDNCISGGGRADAELSRFHYSFLNSSYNNDAVNNDWDNVCLDDIKRNLGYRIELVNGTYPNTAALGSQINILINLENVGYAPPFNPRGLELVLRHLSSGDLYYAPLQDDPRFWENGSHLINTNLCLPPNIPMGNYELLLNLPDPKTTLFNNPLYAIRLANQGLWEASTGFNKLNHTISITNTSNSSICSSQNDFSPQSVYDPSYCPSTLLLNNNTVDTDIYIAKHQLSSSNATIQNNKNVLFQSGNTIELNIGFEVQHGAQFLGIIQDCYEGF